MEKLKMNTVSIVETNLKKIEELFPSCITETIGSDGRIIKKVDIELLKSELSGVLVEGGQEKYSLNWPGKNQSIVLSNSPTMKCLRPRLDESLGFDHTENILIEGDNLEALKLMQESYLGKIKMIYIDPPYNTGNDFIYDDDFVETVNDYFTKSGQSDHVGNKLVANNEYNGRFHSDWLSMMYPRLRLARNLMSDSGVIFISIGVDELHNLKKIMDEIYGSQNHIVTFSRMMKSGGAKGRFYTPNIDYILAYAKNINETKYFRIPLNNDQIERFYNKKEVEGDRKGELYGEERLYKASLDHRPNQRYYIKCPDGSYVIPPGKNFPKKIEEGEKVKPTSEDGVWKWIYPRYRDEYKAGNIIFKETNTSALVDQNGNKSKWNLYNKMWLKDQLEKGAVPSNLIQGFENRQSSAELKELEIPFDFAKPVNLIVYLLQLASVEDGDIVLDFFAGSGTTAHSLMQLNALDGLNRRYILVQLPEPCDQDSIAYKQGFKNITEITRQRIINASKKISSTLQDNQKINLDLGFRYFAIDSTNMSDTYYNPSETHQNLIDIMADNVKQDRTAEDLLFQVLLDLGVELSLPITKESIMGNEVYFVDNNALVACFANNGEVTEEFCKELTKKQPVKVVFRDAGFKNDSVKINVEQIFKLMSPTTTVKTI